VDLCACTAGYKDIPAGCSCCMCTLRHLWPLAAAGSICGVNSGVVLYALETAVLLEGRGIRPELLHALKTAVMMG
jgi:hypothetical protein